MTRGGVAAVVLGCVVVAAAPAPAADRIVFKADREDRGDPDLYTMLRDGSGLRRLTYQIGNDYWPRVDRSGRRLAYERDAGGAGSQVITRLLDGRSRVAFAAGTQGPAFSPGGDQVAYSLGGDLFRAKVDGTDSVRLTAGPALDQLPSWSPDGRTIVFQTRDRYAPGEVDLALVDARGEAPDRPVRPLVVRTGVDGYPSWAPDGRTIAFQAGEPGNLHTVSAEGGATTEVLGGPANDRYPTWTPRGDALVFVSDRSGAGFDVHRLPLGGFEPQIVSPSPGYEDTPIEVAVADRDDDSVLDDADPCPAVAGAVCAPAATIDPPHRIVLGGDGTTKAEGPGAREGDWSGPADYAPGRDGPDDRAFAFGGTSSVTVPGDAGRFGTDVARIGLAFRTTSATGTQTLVAKRSTCGEDPAGWWEISLDPKGVNVAFGGSVAGLLPAPGAFADGRWHDVDVQRAGQALFVTVDGRTVGFAYTGPSDLGTTGPLVIGSGPCAGRPGRRAFTGEIDDVVLVRRTDADRDGTPDDPDEDGAVGAADTCPGVANPGQADGDGDGVGDACDTSSPQTPADADAGDGDPAPGADEGTGSGARGTPGTRDVAAGADETIAPAGAGAPTRRSRTVAAPGTRRSRTEPKAGPPAPTPQTRPVAAPAAGPPPAAPRRRSEDERAVITAALLRPAQVPLTVEDIARSLGIGALLMLLLALPVVVINSTVNANRDEILRWWAPVRRVGSWATRGAVRRMLTTAVTSVVAGTALYVFLDPEFPLRDDAGAFAAGILVGLSAIVANHVLIWRWYLRRHSPGFTGGWRVYPGQVAFAALCVVLSRVASFTPGLMLGTPGDFEVDRPLHQERHCRRLLIGVLALGAMSLTAWVVSIPVAQAASEPGAGSLLRMVDVALAVIAIAGMETLVFALIPLPFLDGYALAHWRPRVWLAVWGTGIAWVSIVLLNPAISAPDSAVSIPALVALASTLTIAALGLWTFFWLRGRRAGVSV